MIKAHDVSSIVVRAPNWVGDAVMSVAALRELRRLFPNSHITVVSKPGTAEVFAGADYIDDVLVYKRDGLKSFLDQVRAWKQREFDLALLFQNAFEAAAISFMAHVPLRVGYATERRALLLGHAVPVPVWKHARHEIFYYLNLVAELEKLLIGSTLEPSAPDFGISVSDNQKRQARRLLRGRKAESKPLVLLCPGSVNSRAKRWPAERYATLADQFADMGATVALIGAPSELDVSQSVAMMTRRPPLVLTGQTSVSEVIALISIADVLITNDTGPAHIGAAVGTPTLVIFGPTNPLTTRPFGPASEIIHQPPECAPCMLRDCPIDHRCMTAIAPEAVFDRAQRIMRQRLEVAV
ncbi:MAG: lipopolysaccharide heptosyltransferase II [Acidobacteriota bacterium]